MPSPARSLLLILPAAAAALALAGCGLQDDGPHTTQTRDVADFTRIDNRGSVDVRLHVGRPQRVRVSAGRKIIGDVRTVVRDGTLEVSFQDGLLPSSAVVEATVPRLTGMHVSGSGDIDADGVRADALEVRSDGSADLEVHGRARRLAVDLDGSGDARLDGLAARDARVTIGGSGDAEVRADRRLEVSVDGSGDVRYHGDPLVNQHVDGSGDVRRAQ